MNVNKKDRWGTTPIDYAIVGSLIEQLLLSAGANRTLTNITLYPQLTSGPTPLSVNEIRLFYAVYYNDPTTIKNLDSLGVKIN